MYIGYYHPQQLAFHILAPDDSLPMGKDWEFLYEHEDRKEIEILLDSFQEARNRGDIIKSKNND